MSRLNLSAAALCAVMLCVSSTSFGVIITPINVTTGSLTDTNAVIANLINHNGLDPTTLQHTNSFSTQNHWRTTTAANMIDLTFDLGAVFEINQMQVWNYNEGNTGGAVLRIRIAGSTV